MDRFDMSMHARYERGENMLVGLSVRRRLTVFTAMIILGGCGQLTIGAKPIQYRIAAFDGYSEFSCIRSSTASCHVVVGRAGEMPVSVHRIAEGDTLRIENVGKELAYCIDPNQVPEWPKCRLGMWTGQLRTSTHIKQWYEDSR
jgi:hypothetical protein